MFRPTHMLLIPGQPGIPVVAVPEDGDCTWHSLYQEHEDPETDPLYFRGSDGQIRTNDAFDTAALCQAQLRRIAR